MRTYLLSLGIFLTISCSKQPETDAVLATDLKKAEEYYKPFLPRMADDETRLDSVHAGVTELTFNSTFVHTKKSELGDLTSFTADLREELLKQSQSLENLNDLVRQGATLVYSYRDQDGLHVTNIRIGPDAPLVSKAHLDEPLNAAKMLYERYVQHTCNFDSSLAHLYADEALLQMTRKYPDGTSETRTVPAGKHKEFIWRILPIAKQRGDTCRFSETNYTLLGEDKVRVTVKMYSDLGKYWSDVSLLLVRTGDKWSITEHVTVSEMPTNEKK